MNRGAFSSLFLLLGGAATLPGAAAARTLATKPAVARCKELEMDWHYFRMYGVNGAKRDVRRARLSSRLGGSRLEHAAI